MKRFSPRLLPDFSWGRLGLILLGSAIASFGLYNIHALSGVTEGGILGAVWEMCQIAGVGCQLQEEAIPVASVTRKICTHYGINYLRLISSGAMIIMTAPEKKEEMLQKLSEAGVPVCQIGRILPASEGLMLQHVDGSSEIIDPPGPDELYKVVK